IVVLLLIYKNLITHIGKLTTDKKFEIKDGLSHSSQLTELLIAGHQSLSDLCPEVHCDDVQDSVNTVARLLDEVSISRDIIINNNIRFYHVQRLVKAMFILSKNSSHIYSFSLFSDINLECSHALVRECIHDIKVTKTINPLFKIWKKVISYDY